ncbi:hypothetical protein Tco_1155394 [Tanacetum coccineum]
MTEGAYMGVGTGDGIATDGIVTDDVTAGAMVTDVVANEDKGIPGGLAVEDLGVADVEEGAEGAIIEEEVILKRAIDKGKGIMLQEANSRRKRKSRPRGNGIVIEDDANPSFTDDGDSDSSSETEIQFGTNNNNRTDDGCDYNMYSDSDSEYSDKSVDYLSEGEEECRSSVIHRRSESKDRFRTKDVGGYSVAEVGGTSANNLVQTKGEKRVKYTTKKGWTGKRGNMRGGAGKRGGLGISGFGRLGAWFGLDAGGLNTFVEEPETHQSQAPTTSATTKVERAASATIASGPSQATLADQPRQEWRVRLKVPPVRLREKSQRILSKNIGGACSSRFNVQDVD